jgi:hypothetical protein
MTSNAAALMEHHLYALVADEARDPLGMAEGRDAGIGDRHHAADPQTPELPARVLRSARQSRAACAPAPNPPRLSARATVVLPYA